MQRPDLVLAFGFSGWEWLIVMVVALLLFGRRLPDIMRGLGSSVKEFKKGMEEVNPAAPSHAPPPPPSGAISRESAPQAPPASAAVPPAQQSPKA
jgi:sec-independent protein translocase protein TatA